jgi:hypothetical protein
MGSQAYEAVRAGAPTLVTAAICVRLQPKPVLSGTINMVSTATAVAISAKFMPETAAKTNRP